MNRKVAKRQTVVLFGDSTTAPRGELKIYEKHLSERFPDDTFINAGVPGDTTEMARARFKKDVLKHNPDIIVIQFGINDAAIDVWKDPPEITPRVDINEYEANLRFFIDVLLSKGIITILMSPNKCCWTNELQQLYGKPPYNPNDTDGFNFNLSRYAEIVRKIAKDTQVSFVDIYKEYENFEKYHGNISELLLDGMHPNDKGHKLVADLLSDILRK